MPMEIQDAILERLQTKGPATVEELAKQLQHPQGLIRAALFQLREKQLVYLRYDNNWVVNEK
jgi:predicted ArsR family transcriptional regulator